MCGSKVVTVEPTLLGFASLLETKNCTPQSWAKSVDITKQVISWYLGIALVIKC